MLITYQSRLIEKKEIAPQVLLLKCTWPENKEWTYKAGQYMIIHIPQESGHPARRLYSIASHPSHTDHLEFIIEIIPNGIGGTYISSLKEGESLTLQGSAGLFIYRSTGRTPIFLATGTGIAPMRSMIHELIHQNQLPSGTRLLWGLKYRQDGYLFEEFEALQKNNPGLQIDICLSREERWDDNNLQSMLCPGRVTAHLDKLSEVNQLANHDYYLCGGKHVVEGLREYFKSHNVPETQVFFEKFT